MGFNTVAMLLNDYSHELIRSPHSLAWALCHPPHSARDIEEKSWAQQVASVARDHNERTPVRGQGGGLTVLPTFHADSVQFLYAGRNTLKALTVLRYGAAKVDYEEVPGGLKKLLLEPKEVKTVTLILPDWAHD